VSNTPAPETSQLTIITVTFHPDVERLGQQVDALPPDAWLVVVDNASADKTYRQLQQRLAARPQTHLVRNETNLGLAKALNQGAEHAIAHIESAQYLLLMDQDSVPFPNAITRLLAAHAELESRGLPVGCVGPRLVDRATGLQHGFHRIKGWRWSRVYPAETDHDPIECANLNGSGTLMRINFFSALGGLDERLFIDHVDTEWAFRVLNAKFLILGIPDARFDHAMGEKSLRFWCFGWRIWPQRSPKRHYYLFRNAVWLMGRSYVPMVWKSWAVIKLFLTLVIHIAIDPQRVQQLRQMFGGIIAGLCTPAAIEQNLKPKSKP
jgi:rhamnosyltransferase